MGSKLAWTGCVVFLLACGDDSASTTGNPGSGGGETSCLDDVWSCPAGQTCWADATGKSFACLNSGAAASGEACQSIAGMPTCAEDLICLQLQTTTPGTCIEYCDPGDPAHACPDMRPCVQVQLASSKFYACQPAAAEGGGGAGGGPGGGPGSGGSGGS